MSVPVTPLTFVGPVALSVHAVGAAVPPLSFVTVLTSVSRGAMAVLLMVQVALSPKVQGYFQTPGGYTKWGLINTTLLP